MTRLQEVKVLTEMAINRTLEEKRVRATAGSVYGAELDPVLDALDAALTALEEEVK